MKGLLLPKGDLHLSERLPKMGVRKKPTSGDRHHISVICDWETPERSGNSYTKGFLHITYNLPILSSVGDTKAVSAA